MFSSVLRNFLSQVVPDSGVSLSIWSTKLNLGKEAAPQLVCPINTARSSRKIIIQLVFLLVDRGQHSMHLEL